MTGTKEAVESIAIFGKSHEIWPLALLLTQELPKNIKITLVEDRSERDAAAAFTLVQQNRVHERIGVSNEDLVQHCHGTFGLGVDCVGWQGDNSSFFVAPSGDLPAIQGSALCDVMLRAAIMHDDIDRFADLFHPFRFAAKAALAGKFAIPEANSQSPLSMLRPTIQFDRTAYSDLLESRARPYVEAVHHALPAKTEWSSDGALRSVKLDDRTQVSADFFIDASGALSSLTDMGAKEQFGLPFDRITTTLGSDREKSTHSNTKAKAVKFGLLIETPLGNGEVSKLVYSSSHLEEQGGREFDMFVDNSPWESNLVRVGSAAASLGPYWSADTLILQEQAQILADHIPTCRDMQAEARAYTDLQKAPVEEIRDFVMLPMLLNRRECDFWKSVSLIKIPDTLALRLGQFESRGRFVSYDNEIFDQQTWIEKLIGFGVKPRRYHPVTEGLNMRAILPDLRQLAADFDKVIANMPSHEEFMDQYRDQLIPKT